MEWIEVAKTEELPEGGVKPVLARGQRLALARTAGGFHAVAEFCTHAGGSLGEGTLFEEEIECPLHGARFNVTTGEAATLPAVEPVKVFPVKVENDRIFVQL